MDFKKKALPFVFAVALSSLPLVVKADVQHTVKNGETLWKISHQYHVTVTEMQAWNQLNSDQLRTGQTLTVKPPNASTVQEGQKSYTVKSGDTLYGIALRNKITVKQLAEWNELKSNSLYIGQQLFLSKPTIVETSQSTKKAATTTSDIHMVKQGETLFGIGKKYNVTVLQLQAWNKLTNKPIRPGQKLIVKEAEQLVEETEVKPAKGVMKQVTVSVLNMRKTPTTKSPIVGKLSKGTNVTVTSEKDGWSAVTVNGKQAWVASTYLSEVKDATVTSGESQDTNVKENKEMTVAVNVLNVRKGPGTNQARLTSLNKGKEVSVLETRDGWSRILFDGKTGWVSSQYLTGKKTGTETAGTTTILKNKKTIVVDAGHGGYDPGAIALDRTREEDVTLAVSLKLLSELENRGYNVKMVRTTDSSCSKGFNSAQELQCRVNLSNRNNADAYVSIHANTAGPFASGTETFYSAGNSHKTQSAKLAAAVHENYQPAFGSKNRKVKTGSYYVLQRNTVPAILLEIGFLSDSHDLAKLKSDVVQQRVARGIANGIDSYFSN